MSPFGLMTPAQMVALTFRRHMHQYGTPAEVLGHVAVTFREHAQRNPRALHRRQAAHLRDAPGLADDRGSVPAVRLLPRDRRRGRADRDLARARARPEEQAGAHPRGRAGERSGLGARSDRLAQHAVRGLCVDQFEAARPHPVRDGRADAGRSRRRAGLRRVQRPAGDGARGLRHLQAGRGRGLHHVGRARLAGRRAAGQHRGRAPLRRLSAGPQSHPRRRAADARHLDRAGRRTPRPAWSPAAARSRTRAD